jgi:hypothetical protein
MFVVWPGNILLMIDQLRLGAFITALEPKLLGGFLRAKYIIGDFVWTLYSSQTCPIALIFTCHVVLMPRAPDEHSAVHWIA